MIPGMSCINTDSLREIVSALAAKLKTVPLKLTSKNGVIEIDFCEIRWRKDSWVYYFVPTHLLSFSPDGLSTRKYDNADITSVPFASRAPSRDLARAASKISSPVSCEIDTLSS